MKKRDEAITRLAEYITAGSRVSGHSMGLQIGGARKEEADAFFALRNSFGVSGYATQDEAIAAITATIGG